MAQINPVAVADDISRVRERLERARSGAVTHLSTSRRLEPHVWPEAGAESAQVSRSRLQSPGPKYNLQPQLSRYGSGIPKQLPYYTCKDISFLKSKRMPDGE